jgi:molecular chaperone DnaK
MPSPKADPVSGDPIIGIDLGTTFSAVAYADETTAVPQILENREDGQRTTPSVIYFDPSGIPVVGAPALNVAASEPERVVQFVKREMGNTEYVRYFDGKEWTPESISACILRHLKHQAEQCLDRPVGRAVISVPAYFKDAAKTATIAAGTAADLEVVALINEPTAASIAYGLGKAGEHQTLLVYDFGGGTFDVTVLRIDGRNFTVLATDGDAKLGGFNINERMVDYLAQAFLDRHGVDLRRDPQSNGDLWNRAEQAKKSLSSRQSVMVTLSHEQASMRVDLDREQFNELIGDLIGRTTERMERALASARMDWTGIDAVLPVGGSSKIPAVRDMLQSVTGKRLTTTVNPDEVVACGAALRAHLADLTESAGQATGGPQPSEAPTGIVVRDVAPHSLGVKAADAVTGNEINSIILPRLTQVPCERVRTYSTVADGQSRIELFILQGEDPDPFSPEVEPVGRLVLGDLPPRPAGEVMVSVALRYDSNGVIEVEATELAGGRVVREKLLKKVGELDPELLRAMKSQVGKVGSELPVPEAPLPEAVPIEPAPTEPVATEPVAAEPAPTERAPAEPVATEPGPVRPVTAGEEEDGTSAELSYDFDYYDLLELAPDASADAVEEALVNLERRWSADDSDSESRDPELVSWMREKLGAARSILLDQGRRAEYDSYRSEPDTGFGEHAGSSTFDDQEARG